MAHTNPITTPVVDDTNTNTTVNDTLPIHVPTSPMRLTFAPETMTLHGERNVTNDGESTAVHDADKLQSVILNDPGTPGILLRAYDDLRGHVILHPARWTVYGTTIGRSMTDVTLEGRSCPS